MYKKNQNIDQNFYLTAGANLRFKRSESRDDWNLDSNGRCLTARNWMNDCNQCFCVENGVPACTLKGCIHLPELVSVITEPTKETSNLFISHKAFLVSIFLIYYIFFKQLVRRSSDLLQIKNASLDLNGKMLAIHVGAQMMVCHIVPKLDVLIWREKYPKLPK